MKTFFYILAFVFTNTLLHASTASVAFLDFDLEVSELVIDNGTVTLAPILVGDSTGIVASSSLEQDEDICFILIFAIIDGRRVVILIQVPCDDLPIA